MSCGSGGQSCETPRRRAALVMLGVMALVFIALSAFSFLKSRGQVTPDTVSFGTYQAADGKRVFQAYNCMGCHTMVGNGAYLGPDLTREYERAGPAWLAAFLPSAGSWPTSAAVRTQLQNAAVHADTGSDSIEAYVGKYPGAAARIERRQGSSQMPNLPLTQDEVGQLIAYLKYTSAMNTEGWPPKVEVAGGLDKRLQLAHGAAAAVAAVLPAAVAAPAPAAVDPAAHGAQLVKDYGCTACHSTDAKRLVGPGWGGLYGTQVALADGTTVRADDAYLAESIRQPNAKIVAGYPKGVMPAYATLLSDADVSAVVAYLHSLEKQ